MTKEAHKILNKYWGYDQFRGSQQQIINAVLNHQDVIALMPTAGGKSICYQIPAMSVEGICIVISPLVALIQDQVSQLKSKGIKAIGLTGGISQNDLIQQLDNCIYGNYKFLYLSPERLQQRLVQERIANMPVNLIAIDEAHCISQWGHDFRPAYLECSVLRDLHPEVNLIALTATATTRVVNDIRENLRINSGSFFRDSFLRENIIYRVVLDENKPRRLLDLCSRSQKSIIVYARTRRQTVELTRLLKKDGIPAEYFHGGLPREEKGKKLNAWLENVIQVMVATNAFGMGVDKPDVGLVVHYQIPDCIENYFQESGRVGRDGSEAEAIMIVGPGDEAIAREQFIDSLPDISFLKLLYKKLNSYFQISYGEGNDLKFRFNYNDFCQVYKLDPSMTYNGLQILDQYSVLSLSQSFSRRTTLQFTVGKQVLLSYLEKNPKLVSLVQNALRTYGGIFDFDTKINTGLLAKKTGLEEGTVHHMLEILAKDGIVEYCGSHTDLEITFLVPREDDSTINTFAPKIKELQNLKVDKLHAMLNYVQNNQKCRNIQLLNYFGEVKKDSCGKCDVCVDNLYKDPSIFTDMVHDILDSLEQSRKTSRQLIKALPYEEKEILHMLQRLLEEEQIEINSRNEYLKSS